MPAQAQMQQPSAAQANLMARQAIMASGLRRCTPLPTITINPAQVNPIQITPRGVGLVTGFLITGTATIQNNDGVNALTLTDVGLANLFSQVVFNDLNNQTRIQTSGWHLAALNALKHRRIWGGAETVQANNQMLQFGENFLILSAPATIAANGNATVRFAFEIPLAYGPHDFRGAIYMNVNNAQAQILLTVNQAPFTAAGADSTNAVYKGTANAVISSITLNPYQLYWDQIPFGKQGPILPLLDLGTTYELKITTLKPGPTQAVDFPYQYPNFRSILSTFAIYNHDSTVDTGRTGGTDINYWALQSANFTNIWQRLALDEALDTRNIIGTDLPKGFYYFSSRQKPINSNQYGNIELIVNASTATVNDYLTIALEDFNIPNQMVMAGSLQAG